jgi:UDP-N-acetylmuramoyl-tripeptide--D-alanyl-D-alanine ligase
MLPDSIAQLAQAIDAQTTGAATVQGFAIDSRTIEAGDLFVALKGQRDGHDFLTAAAEAGATAALVSRPQDILPAIEVSDTEVAMTDLARHFRSQFTQPVVALTGSQGKTSTRGFIASVLSKTAAHQQREVLVTRGNFNNQLGVPLTAARLRPDHAFAIFELGASAVGDIAHIAGIVRPHVSALLNARAAHLEGFGSKDGVIEGKGEIIDHTDPNGTVVLNVDEPAFPIWKRRAGDRVVRTFGCNAGDVQWHPKTDQAFELQIDGIRYPIRLPTLGQHFMENAAAATAMCLAVGASIEDICDGLETATIEPGRMTPLNLNGLRLIDDTYNASPEAVCAAIDWLAGQSGTRMLVMGHLAELGPDASDQMRTLGQYAKANGIDVLVAVGDALPIADGFGADALYFPELSALEAEISLLVQSVDTALVKGSRSARMDRVVSTLSQALGRI